MPVHKTPRHTIDLLFPATLLFLFGALALVALLSAANIYRSTADGSAMNHSARTSLAYIGEKLRQSDGEGQIYLDRLQGEPALVLEQTLRGQDCRTYIYLYEQELKELFVMEGAQASAAAGRTITPVEDFSMEELQEGLFCFTCTDEKGQSASSVVSIRSLQP